MHLQPNRAVFDAAALPAGEYAASLGLAVAPELRFLKRGAAQGTRAHGAEGRGATAHSASDSSGDEGEAGRGARAKQAGRSDSTRDDGDDFLVVKRSDALGVGEGRADEPGPGPLLGPTPGSGKKKRLRIRPDRPSGSRMVFDEEGRVVDPLAQLVPEGSAR